MAVGGSVLRNRYAQTAMFALALSILVGQLGTSGGAVASATLPSRIASDCDGGRGNRLAGGAGADEGSAASGASAGAEPLIDGEPTGHGNGKRSSAGTASHSGYAKAVLADHPFIYWRLGEQKANKAADAAKGDHGAKYSGRSKAVAGAIGGDPDTAVRLDGAEDVVKWKPDATYAGAFSVEAWVRSDLRGVDDQAIVSTRGNHHDHSFDVSLADSDEAGYGIRVEVGDGGRWFVTETIPFTWKMDRWYHVAAVASLTDLRIYVNGTSIGVLRYPTSGTPLLFDAKHPVQIGRASRSEGWFDGTIDEVGIYDHILTAAQVMAHYVAGTTSSAPSGWPGGPQASG